MDKTVAFSAGVSSKSIRGIRDRSESSDSVPERNRSHEYEVECATYLDECHVSVYLRDVIRIVMCKEKITPPSSSSSIPDPLFGLNIIHKYFQSVMDGTNVLQREYAYVSATPRNRLSFLRHFKNSLRSIDPSMNVTASDVHNLIGFICPDFPKAIVEFAAAAIEVSPGELVPFSRLEKPVHICFYYNSFFAETAFLFRHISKSSAKERSVTPADEEELPRHSKGSSTAPVSSTADTASPRKKENRKWSSTVDRELFLHGLRKQYDKKAKLKVNPPWEIIERLLSNREAVPLSMDTTGTVDNHASQISWRFFCVSLLTDPIAELLMKI